LVISPISLDGWRERTERENHLLLINGYDRDMRRS